MKVIVIKHTRTKIAAPTKLQDNIRRGALNSIFPANRHICVNSSLSATSITNFGHRQGKKTRISLSSKV